MSKLFLSGNEAIARGAYAAGCHVASAYPGTPSTEILENIAKFKGEINCEWSVNEKVAMEIGIGASVAGARALVCMKHVGLNVAMDPLMTYTYEGVHGGLVVVSADDPGMHSSQNEQDNRVLQKFARAITLEPSDSQEAFDMARAAWDLSERTGSIVFLRMTTRTSHSSSLVDVGDIDFASLMSKVSSPKSDLRPETCGPETGFRLPPKPYVKNPKKYVSVPANARAMRFEVEKRLEVLRQESEASPFNREEPGERTDFGFVASAAAYNYVKEAFPEFPVFKVGFSNPLPAEKIRAFAAKVGALVVVEELDPVLRDAIVLAGIPVRDYQTELRMMELNVDRLRALRAELLGDEVAAPAPEKPAVPPLPTRPPTLCAGCGHRGVFYTLAKLKATVTGDIGCYTLGVAPPLSSMDTTICMGASIGAAFGMRKAGYKGRLAAVIGDSTFFHSGMTGLLDVVYNKGAITVVVLDNRITGMTGHQPNPGTGRTLLGEPTVQTSIAEVARALGVKRVHEVDVYNLKQVEETLKEELDCGEPSVVVAYGSCVIAAKKAVGAVPHAVDPAKCKSCGACFKLGCPAIVRGEETAPGRFRSKIEPAACIGCDVCAQVCPFKAIASTKK
ncbi:MAG: indolepyruvate ferredoxin oxidoreductase subunit alpha [Kiritimatiellae bacterium]|nr:indolepyruvate ferredoxin oxidoreductase subunit alpha [Kiritimatiellia bacterium]